MCSLEKSRLRQGKRNQSERKKWIRAPFFFFFFFFFFFGALFRSSHTFPSSTRLPSGRSPPPKKALVLQALYLKLPLPQTPSRQPCPRSCACSRTARRPPPTEETTTTMDWHRRRPRGPTGPARRSRPPRRSTTFPWARPRTLRSGVRGRWFGGARPRVSRAREGGAW